MTKETVIYLRGIFMDECPNNAITIIADNMIYFRESVTLLKWDDDKELLWALRHNQEVRENYRYPVQFQAVPYECIQYMSVDVGSVLANKIAGDIGFDAVKSAAFIDKLDLAKNPPL